jgi:predicted enzyme related to lactoylglutathione lyase
MLTANYVPGAPIWIDLGAPDVNAAAAFYGAIFGWEFRSAGPDAGGYGMFALDGKTVAAAGPITEEGASPAWTLYFHTFDADATAKAVEQAGGKVRFAPSNVFDQGRMAGFSDPTGAQFAVWQPGATKGLDIVTAPNTLCWTELHTTDPAAATAFYHSVFDWTTEDMPMGEFTYTIVRPAGGGADSGQGGIMGINDEMLRAGETVHWQPYFEVTDCDAVVSKAAEQGATVLMPPDDVPNVGRIALVVDPFGAPFALLTSAMPA